MIRREACLVALLSVTGVGSASELIDFESIPGGVPADGAVISTQFEATCGVTFSLANGSAPVLAKVGPPRTAFQGYGLLPDQPAPGTGTGAYFLTDDGVVSGPPSDLIVTYTVPVQAASGVLLDIDGNEAWTVSAFDDDDELLASIDLGPNDQLDGSATPWSFSLSSAVIRTIRLSYTGSQTSGVGLAFDNFRVSAPACPADVNGDGAVDGADLGILLSGWGAAGAGDIDSSGSIDGADLSLLLGSWGPCPT